MKGEINDLETVKEQRETTKKHKASDSYFYLSDVG